MIAATQADRYREIIDEMKELLGEADRILRQSDSKITKERARGYCHAQIACALDKEHNFVGGSMFTMADIADELESQAEGQEEESEDEDESN